MEGKVENIFADEFEDFRKRKSEKDYFLIDVRQPEEYQKGHIPGALLIPLRELPEKLKELERGRDLVFYCQAGGRSAMAARIALESRLDFGRIYHLVGGYEVYEGKALIGFPKIDIVFQEDAKIPSVIFNVLELEKGAYDFYDFLYSHGTDQIIKDFALKMKEVEKKHARLIYDMATKKGLLGSEDDMFFDFDAFPSDIVEGGMSMTEALDQIRKSFEDSCMALMEFSVVLELQAYDLYRNIAMRFETSELSEFFLDLADQERSHLEAITNLLEDCGSFRR